jgi:hypothetical protein
MSTSDCPQSKSIRRPNYLSPVLGPELQDRKSPLVYDLDTQFFSLSNASKRITSVITHRDLSGFRGTEFGNRLSDERMVNEVTEHQSVSSFYSDIFKIKVVIYVVYYFRFYGVYLITCHC